VIVLQFVHLVLKKYRK